MVPGAALRRGNRYNFSDSDSSEAEAEGVVRRPLLMVTVLAVIAPKADLLLKIPGVNGDTSSFCLVICCLEGSGGVLDVL